MTEKSEKSEKLENKLKNFQEKLRAGWLEKELGEKMEMGGVTSFLLGTIGALDYIETFNLPPVNGYPLSRVFEHLSKYSGIYLGVGIGGVIIGNYLCNLGAKKEKNHTQSVK